MGTGNVLGKLDVTLGTTHILNIVWWYSPQIAPSQAWISFLSGKILLKLDVSCRGESLLISEYTSLLTLSRVLVVFVIYNFPWPNWIRCLSGYTLGTTWIYMIYDFPVFIWLFECKKRVLGSIILSRPQFLQNPDSFKTHCHMNPYLGKGF